MGNPGLLRRPARVFYGWYVVAACAIIYGLGLSLSTLGFSVIFLPVSKDLGLNRATLSLVASLSRAEGAIEGPAVGWLIDRLGPRFLIMVGLVLAGVGYLLLSQVHSYMAFVALYLGLISLGTGASLHAPAVAAANAWFRRRRALAMSISLSGGNAGAAFVVPLYSAIVLAEGWRTGVVLVGLVMLLLLMPLGLVVRRSPESMGLSPDGEKPGQLSSEKGSDGTERIAKTASGEVDFSVGQALRTSSFWMLALGTGFFSFAWGAILVHFIPILVWKGMEQQQAANMMGLAFLGTTVTRPFIGWMGDRTSKSKLLAIGMTSGMVGLFLLTHGQALWTIWLGVILLGMITSFTPLQFALVGEYFGRRNFATLRGVIQFLISPGSMATPFLAGLVYDRTQSYELALVPMAGIFAAATVIYVLLKAPTPSRRLRVLAP